MSETNEGTSLTPQEMEAVYQYLNQSQGAPVPEDKHNVHTFLFRVATSEDTTKVGYLKDEEVGIPKHPVRGFKEFALISSDIISNKFMSDYFEKESEIVTSTSLSRDGFLVNKATEQVRKIADVTKVRKQNKGWFSKKSDDDKEQ
jgi:hypothetical protein